jgi:hypothetical protein
VNRHRWVTPCALAAALVLAVLTPRGAAPRAAEPSGGPPGGANVYVYPKKLTPQDKLSFGHGSAQKKPIPIKKESTLVYVDLAPDARFAHPTQCILISADGAQVIHGDWWLVLNGKPLFRAGKGFKVDFPIPLSGK